MYCPQCATVNPGDVKFCRSCGTALEAVALALSGKSKSNPSKDEISTEEDWIGKHITGVSNLTRGSILLGVSLLLAVPMGIFIPASFDAPWILVWTVFFGWMAVWGGIEMANGLSAVLESKSRLRLIEATGKRSIESEKRALLRGGESVLSDRTEDFRSSTPGSITEGTTRQLKE